MTTCLTTSGKFLKKLNKNRGVAELVPHFIWEHRTSGGLCEEVFRTFAFTLHCHDVFGVWKSWSEFCLTTYLTTLGKFLEKIE